jgi:mono/diheme cytochrome c family protein
VACLLLLAFMTGQALAQAQTGGGEAGPAAPRGNAERGRQLFVKSGCYQCHGYEAQGGAAGSKLGPDPWPWVAFSHYVRSPVNNMPPYTTKVLSDTDLADIYAFVSSRPQPGARPNLLAR